MLNSKSLRLAIVFIVGLQAFCSEGIDAFGFSVSGRGEFFAVVTNKLWFHKALTTDHSTRYISSKCRDSRQSAERPYGPCEAANN